MNRILILIAFLATPQLYADPYETAQQFTAGDVISADPPQPKAYNKPVKYHKLLMVDGWGVK